MVKFYSFTCLEADVPRVMGCDVCGGNVNGRGDCYITVVIRNMVGKW